jgi:predicted peptidase
MKTHTISLGGLITKDIETGYLINVPDQPKNKPVLVYMPGAGDRTDDVSKLHNSNIKYSIPKEYQDDFIIVIPQCKTNGHYEPDDIKYILNDIVKLYQPDENRIYFIGFSLGARGIWDFATAYPDIPTAIVPISGYSCYLKASKIAHIPAVVIHGKNDHVVPFEESNKMVSGLMHAGAKAVYTVFHSGGHNDFFNYITDPSLYKWMLQYAKS